MFVSRRVLIVGAMTLLLVAGLAAFLRGNIAGQLSDEPNQISGPPFTAEVARHMAGELRSGDVARVSDVIVLPPETMVPVQFVEQMQTLTALTFDPATFVDHGDGTAQVQATTTGPGANVSTWTTYLVLEQEDWKLSVTVIS